MILYFTPSYLLLALGSVAALYSFVFLKKLFIPSIKSENYLYIALSGLLMFIPLLFSMQQFKIFMQYKYIENAKYIEIDDQGIKINKLSWVNEDYGNFNWNEIKSITNKFGKGWPNSCYIEFRTNNNLYCVNCLYLPIRKKEFLNLVEKYSNQKVNFGYMCF